MAQASSDNEQLKEALKEALVEASHEQRRLLHDVFAEVPGGFALAEAINEGGQTGRAERKEVFDALEDGT